MVVAYFKNLPWHFRSQGRNVGDSRLGRSCIVLPFTDTRNFTPYCLSLSRHMFGVPVK